MNKDVIYIDVEDDITAIIGKVKDAEEKIVALVPPKRVGVLQSVVNLQLLVRAAKQSSKHVVLITNNSALMALAASAKIPVAKNLQSKPQLAEISALQVDDEDDIIDGASLPIGDHAGLPADDLAIDAAISENAAESSKKAPVRSAASKGRGIPKVPNFDKFRKKMVFIVGGGVLAVGLLVWAIFFAPHATVIITARTSESTATASVALSPSASTKLASSTIKTISKTDKQDVSVDFDATGTKDVGEKAEGQVVFENCEDDSTISVPAGTTISANGKTYKTQSSVSVPGGSGGFGGCSQPGESNPVGVTASDIGEEFNANSGTVFSVSGHNNSSSNVYFRATATTDIDGGSKKQVKVVSQQDYDNAMQKIADKETEAIKKQLAAEFEDGDVSIDTTFKKDTGEVTSSPKVGEEASSGKAKLSGSVTYSLTGISKEEANRYLDEYFKKQLEGKDDQRVYDNGAGKMTFTNVSANDRGFTANLNAPAQIGPKIDDQAIKEAAKGKRYGDIQSGIESISGVEDVDIKFWPFWVSQAPGDTNKISVEFKLDEQK